MCAAAIGDVVTTFSVAIKEGDAVPGVGNLTSIDTIAINSAGTWLIEGDTDNANTGIDQVVVRNGVVVAQQGSALLAPAGSTISSFGPGGTVLNSTGDYGWNYFLGGLSTSTDSGIFLDNKLVIQEGAISTAAQFSAGTPYIGFFGARLGDSSQIAIMASIDDAAIATTVDRAIVIANVDALGNLTAENVFAKEGDLLSGQVDTVQDFATGLDGWSFNNNGWVLFVADLNGPTTTDGVVYLGSGLLAQEGNPSPIAGRTWANLGTSQRVALNNLLDYAFTGSLSGDTTTDSVIALNGGIFAQEGSTMPDIAGFTLTGFGTGPIDLDDAGNLYWFGDWNDPDITKDTGIFRNCQLIVQEGVTTIGGQVVESIASVQENLRVSANGEWLIFEGELAGGISGAFLVHMTETSTSYCTAGTTTHGCQATISATGAASAAGLIDFDITIANVEGQKSGIIFYGVSGPTAIAWGTSSFLCVKSPTQRTPPQITGGTLNQCDGTLSLSWNNFHTNYPGSLGTPFAPGSSCWVQGWFRDPPASKTTNMSNALTFTFCP
jgi:hypothetical protein